MALVSTQNALLLAVAGVIYWYMNQPGKIHIQEKLNDKYDYIIGKKLSYLTNIHPKDSKFINNKLKNI